MTDDYVTCRIPDADELAPHLANWDGVDPANPMNRLSIAAYEAPHLVVVPEWDDLGMVPFPNHGVPRCWQHKTGSRLNGEAAPVRRDEPLGAWECYLEGSDTGEPEVVESPDAARWWFAVVLALGAFAELEVDA